VNELVGLTATELAHLIKSKRASCLEVIEAHLDWIARADKGLHCFLSLDEDGAREQARRIDLAVARGDDPGRLSGVPIAIKDNILVKEWPTTCASRILSNYTATYDATVITHLRSEGAILLGRTNMDEFAMGSSTENSAFGPTRNPWDPGRIPGGSSGGSAAAVAARLAPLALGSDTGGSIRQPAGLCGVLGMKPTYGRVSRFGLVAFASSLDQIGPFARSAEDCALLLKILSGYDPHDSTSMNVDVPDTLAALQGDIRGLKIGLPKEYLSEGLHPEVKAVLEAACRQWESLGAEFVEISLPHSEYALAVYYIIAPCEASSNLARFDGVRYGRRSASHSLLELYERSRAEGFGPEVKRRIMLGTYALSAGYYDAYYAKAQKVRTLVKRDFDEAFAEVDLVLTPTSPTPAFAIGEKTDDPLQMYLSDVFTIPCNLAGLPGLSLPGGFSSSDKLPVGLQLLGRPFEEATILRAAHQYLSATNWHRAAPAALAQAG
jgi:aspartyl-tRNA(Asn)/glutamyl-tRNA(Gln) amidotransferase subunit A